MNGQSSNSAYWEWMKPIQLSQAEVQYAQSLQKYEQYKNAAILRFEKYKNYEEWKNEQA